MAPNPHLQGCPILSTADRKACHFAVFAEGQQPPVSGAYSYRFPATRGEFAACSFALVGDKFFWDLCDELCYQYLKHYFLFKDRGLTCLTSLFGALPLFPIVGKWFLSPGGMDANPFLASLVH